MEPNETLLSIHSTDFIYFKRYKREGKKTFKVYIFNNAKEQLGEIYWHGAWRKYVVEFAEGIILDTKCLGAVVDFIHRLMEERKRV